MAGVVMSVRVMGNVWELDLAPSHKLVLLAMADHADHDGRNVHPSVRLIAHKTGYSERQVQRIMRDLEGDKLLIPDSPNSGGRGHTTHYRIVTTNGVILTPFRREERVTSAPEKGDIQNAKGDIHDAKGDMDVTRTVVTVSEPSEEPSERERARELVCAFVVAVTGKVPSQVGPKDLATANELLALGAQPGDMASIVAWFRADPFWQDKGFGFQTVKSQYLKWRSTRPVKVVTSGLTQDELRQKQYIDWKPGTFQNLDEWYDRRDNGTLPVKGLLR